MTDEQIIEFARKYTVDQLGAFDYVASIVNVGTAMHHVCKRLVELHDADQARRERLRSIGRKGGQANKGVTRVTPRRQFKRA
jgi:hypothetical protein